MRRNLGAPTDCGNSRPPRLRVNYLSFPVEWNGKQVLIGARLQIPLNLSGKAPAVIMLHNGSGVNYRGVYYAAALNSAGMATLEIDQYGGRDIGPGRIKPIKALSDVGPAYRLLAARPEIDPERIDVTSMSFGAIEAMLSTTTRNSDLVLGHGNHFKAALPLYPVCWTYNHRSGFEFTDLVDAPIRIFVGSEDDTDEAGALARRWSASCLPPMPRMFRCGSLRMPRTRSMGLMDGQTCRTRLPIMAREESIAFVLARRHVSKPASNSCSFFADMLK